MFCNKGPEYFTVLYEVCFVTKNTQILWTWVFEEGCLKYIGSRLSTQDAGFQHRKPQVSWIFVFDREPGIWHRTGWSIWNPPQVITSVFYSSFLIETTTHNFCVYRSYLNRKYRVLPKSFWIFCLGLSGLCSSIAKWSVNPCFSSRLQEYPLIWN